MRAGVSLFVMACAASAAGEIACSSFSAEADASDGGPADASSSADGGASDGASRDGDPAFGSTVELASGFEGLAGIAANETTAYVVDQGGTKFGVWSLRVNDATPMPQRLNMEKSANRVVVAPNGDVYWSDSGAKRVGRISGTGADQASFVTSEHPIAIAFLAGSVTPPAPPSVVIATVTVGVTPPKSTVEQRSPALAAGVATDAALTNVLDVAAHGGMAYWTDSAKGTVFEAPTLTMKATTVGGAGTEPDCRTIAADDLGIYWIRGDGKVRMRTGGPGGAIEDLATNEQNPQAIAAAPDGVYWMTNDSIRRWSRFTKNTTTIATSFDGKFTGDFSAHTIAVTGVRVVWITKDGRVLGLTK